MTDDKNGQAAYAESVVDVTALGLLNSGHCGDDVCRALARSLVSVSRLCNIKRRYVVSLLAEGFVEHAAAKDARRAQVEASDKGKSN